jgi:hypothetical protein
MNIPFTIRHEGFVTIPLSMLAVFTHAQVNTDSIRTAPLSGLPVLNQAVLNFVEQHMDKRVGTGQCWDLAAEALRNTNAAWDGLYRYGALINPDTDDILPGDIMQFEGVQVVVETPNSKTIEDMSHHTAIVYSTLGKSRFMIAHQNYGRQKKKVGITNLDLTHITTGEVFIYRPTNRTTWPGKVNDLDE